MLSLLYWSAIFSSQFCFSQSFYSLTLLPPPPPASLQGNTKYSFWVPISSGILILHFPGLLGTLTYLIGPLLPQSLLNSHSVSWSKRSSVERDFAAGLCPASWVYLAVSGDIVSLGMSAAGVWRVEAGMMGDILPCTGQPPQQRMTWRKIWVVFRFKPRPNPIATEISPFLSLSLFGQKF